MRPLIAAALGAALVLSTGCSLTIDPESVDPPKVTPDEVKPPPPRSACIGAPGEHKLCGGQISAGAAREIAANHKVTYGIVGVSATDVSTAQHRIVRGDVSP